MDEFGFERTRPCITYPVDHVWFWVVDDKEQNDVVGVWQFSCSKKNNQLHYERQPYLVTGVLENRVRDY